ncbi:MAG: cadherin repeat domain-containing protein [Pseudomonadota bacterium]
MTYAFSKAHRIVKPFFFVSASCLLLASCGGGGGGEGESSSSSPTPTVTFGSNPPVFAAGDEIIAPEERFSTGYLVSASDPEGDDISYRISGGRDAAMFNINSETGLVSFNEPADFETNGATPYEIVVEATDGENPSTQRFFIEVIDQFEKGAIRITNDIPGVYAGYTLNSIGKAGSVQTPSILVSNLNSRNTDTIWRVAQIMSNGLNTDADGEISISSTPKNYLGVRYNHNADVSISSQTGDFNGDGFEDFILNTSTHGQYMVFGSLEPTFPSTEVMIPDFDTNGTFPGGGGIIFEYGVGAVVGDIDADGRDDFISLYKPFTDPDVDAISLYFASDIMLDPDRIIEPEDMEDKKVAILNPENGISKARTGSAGGARIGSAGDLDNDGFGDIFIGGRSTIYDDDTDLDEIKFYAYILFGKDLINKKGETYTIDTLPSGNAIKFIGDSSTGSLGAFGLLSDIDGDGIKDFYILFNGLMTNTSYVSGAGGVLVFSSREVLNDSDGIIDVTSTSPAFFKINFSSLPEGITSFDRSVTSSTVLSDVDGGGIPDIGLAWGYPRDRSFVDRVTILFGEAFSSGFGTEISHRDYEGRVNISLPPNGTDWGLSYISSAGDMDGDGKEDLLIGTPFRGGEGQSTVAATGGAYIVSGSLVREAIVGSEGFFPPHLDISEIFD